MKYQYNFSFLSQWLEANPEIPKGEILQALGAKNFNWKKIWKDSCFRKTERVKIHQKYLTSENIVREILLTGSTGNYLRRQMILW